MIGRRDFIAAGSIAMPSLAIATPMAADQHDELRIAVIRSFYAAQNAGNWAAVDRLFDENAFGRSNSEYYTADEPQKDVSSATVHRGGFMEGGEISSFLRKRQKANGWVWEEFNRESVAKSGRDYFSVLARPRRLDGNCLGPGSFGCGIDPRFVHVFRIKVEEAEGAVVSCRIHDFSEAELLKLGNRYD